MVIPCTRPIRNWQQLVQQAHLLIPTALLAGIQASYTMRNLYQQCTGLEYKYQGSYYDETCSYTGLPRQFFAQK